MDDPVKEIPGIIDRLVKGQPSVQRSTLYTYFTNDAQFIHPFCKAWSFHNSRYLVEYIYRWYKVMSPTIELKVNSVAFDQDNLIVYANISQNFRLWVAPFYQAPVILTTVLKLRKGDNGKYYIASQEDLYQVDQFVRFLYPGFLFAALVSAFWAVASFFCAVGAILFYPFTVVEEQWAKQNKAGKLEKQPSLYDLAVVVKDNFAAQFRRPVAKTS